jgi:hypothetical protein
MRYTNKIRNKGFKVSELIVVVALIALIVWVAPLLVRKLKLMIPVIECQKNMRVLGNALHKYAADNNGLYPTPSKWCDLLVEKLGVNKRKFACMSVGDTICTTDSPVDMTQYTVETRFLNDYNDESGHKKYIYEIKWSHYGLNPNAEPNCAPNMVLLLETKHGWNQYGGSELASLTNHLELSKKEGCNILFNNGDVKFIKPEDIPKLNWGKQVADKSQK